MTNGFLDDDKEIGIAKATNKYSAALIEEILDSLDILQVMEEEYDLAFEEPTAKGWWHTNCPLPGHRDSTPSFGVNPELRVFKCFGCVTHDTLVWTNEKLIPVQNVNLNHQVLGLDGLLDSVISIQDKGLQPVRNIKIKCVFNALSLTDDHICFKVSLKNALKLPYLNSYPSRKLKFSNKIKKEQTFNPKLQMEICEAKDVERGDYMLFPVIPHTERVVLSLNSFDLKQKSKTGKQANNFEILPNKSIARLFGLYVAEGSTSRGCVKFSLHIKERDSIAVELSETLQTYFGLKSSIYFPKERPNSCEVCCSSTYLRLKLEQWFGKGCKNKNIPYWVLEWPVSLQKSFISGYMDGDGYKQRTADTVSEALICGLFALSIQAGELPSTSVKKERTDLGGQKHSKCYTLFLKKQESCKMFYEKIGNTKYLFLQVDEIYQLGEKHVFDIGTKRTQSFTTSICLVHNCQEKGNLIHFVRKIESIPFNDAVAKLALLSSVDVANNSLSAYRALREIDSTVKAYLNSQNTSKLPAGLSPIEYMRVLAERLRAYELKVNFDDVEVQWVDSVYKDVDDKDIKEDQKGMSDIWSSLTKDLKERYANYQQRV